MSGGLAFLKVYEAGHMVPYDQPEHSLEFINMWLHGHNKTANCFEKK
jgi:cathepsin A (carboxypeptidase C)